ncbi:MAG: hypothetical protein WC496_05530 [Phycisphaerae bacterium]
MKAYALFRSRTDNDFNATIKELKIAQKCEYYKSPYSIYKDRAVSIGRKQKLHNRLIEELDFDISINDSTREIYRTLISYQNLLITEGNFTQADEIADVLKMLLKVEYEPVMRSVPHSMRGMISFWDLPQQIDLRRKNLTASQTNAKRMEMCAIASPEKIISYKKENVPKKIYGFYALSLLPFLYLYRMMCVFGVAAAILFIISFVSKDNVSGKLKKADIIRFFVFSSVFFTAGQAILIAEFFLNSDFDECSHLSYADILFIPPHFSDINFRDIKELFKEPFFFFVFVLPFAITILIALIKFFKPKFDNLITRFIAGILISIPLGLATLFLTGDKYTKYLPVIVFLLFVFKYSFRKITFRDIFKSIAGSSRNEIPVLRTNLLKLSILSVILCWLGILFLAAPVKKSMEKEEKTVPAYSYQPQKDYEKAYQNVLNEINDANNYMSFNASYISFVKSVDLPAIIEEFMEKRCTHGYVMPPGFHSEETIDYNTNTDFCISNLLRDAGKDQMPVILSYMKNPDIGRSLIYRAQLGDKSAKEKLQRLLGEKIGDVNNSTKLDTIEDFSKPDEIEIISALAVISEPEYAYELYKDYFERNPLGKECHNFDFRFFCLLPKDLVLKIFNLYLDEVQTNPGSSDDYRRLNPLADLRSFEGLYWDSPTAKRILNLMLGVYDKENRGLETFGVEYYLTSEDAVLLVKGLQSNNEDLRAWCLCQLRKIDYKFSADELKKIAGDKSWKVRANLAIFDKSLINDNEMSAFVNLLKAL